MERLEQIMTVVENFYCLKHGSCQLKTRKREIVQARQIAHYYAKSMTKHSLGTIGAYIGGVDHATVLHSIQSINNLYDTDKSFRNELSQIYERIIKKFNKYITEAVLTVKLKDGQMYKKHFDSIVDAVKSYAIDEVEWVNISVRYIEKVKPEFETNPVEVMLPEMENIIKE